MPQRGCRPKNLLKPSRHSLGFFDLKEHVLGLLGEREVQGLLLGAKEKTLCVETPKGKSLLGRLVFGLKEEKE